MAVLVTGGSGVLGLHVALILAKHGARVVSYSTSGAPPAAEIVLGEFVDRVHFVTGDVQDVGALRRTAESHDISGIIHTAGLTGEKQARARPHDVFSVNVGGTANVLEVARIGNVRRLVYIGSAAEYGPRSDLHPISEDDVNIVGMYAESKFLGHRLCHRYRSIYGVGAITVRVSAVYGPNTRFSAFRGLAGNTLIAHLCRAVTRGEAVTLTGGSDSLRDWTYAADAALGICQAYWASSPRYTVFNIASGRNYTLAEVAAAIRCAEPSARVDVASECNDEESVKTGNLRGPLDIRRACEELNYAPRYTLEAGLREYLAWWREVNHRGVVGFSC